MQYTINLYEYGSAGQLIVDVPVNALYDDKLSSYGKGFVDGKIDQHNRRAMHPSVHHVSGESETRKAYVTGYLDSWRPNWAVK